MKKRIYVLIAIIIAACIWLLCLQLFFKPDLEDFRCSKGISPAATGLAERHLRIWTDPELRNVELQKMQDRNPEWDFMSRTYFMLAFANMALRDGMYRLQACEIMDAIIDNTLATEREKGHRHFLLDYAFMFIILFGVAHLAGFRQYTGVLSGTARTGGFGVFRGVSYLFLYGTAVIVVPMLLIASVIVQLIKIFFRSIGKNRIVDRELFAFFLFQFDEFQGTTK